MCTSHQSCNYHGTCNVITGKCSCIFDWVGMNCGLEKGNQDSNKNFRVQCSKTIEVSSLKENILNVDCRPRGNIWHMK